MKEKMITKIEKDKKPCKGCIRKSYCKQNLKDGYSIFYYQKNNNCVVKKI